jgi:hypothetical protein
MVGQRGGHCRCGSERLVDVGEVAMGEMPGDRRCVILGLLGEGIRKLSVVTQKDIF